MTPPASKADPQRCDYAAWLWFLSFLFLLRVLGQILVTFVGVEWLPPPTSWYSGLLPYRYLLPSQILILVLQAWICLNFTTGKGFWIRPNKTLARLLPTFGAIYFAVMAIRYVIRMALMPDQRWTGGTIPIFFHWVLALFVLAVGRFHAQANATRERRP